MVQSLQVDIRYLAASSAVHSTTGVQITKHLHVYKPHYYVAVLLIIMLSRVVLQSKVMFDTWPWTIVTFADYLKTNHKPHFPIHAVLVNILTGV